jgi:GNAT superfamily N-acetyltransferase
MEKLTFLPIEKGNAAHRELFESLFMLYVTEQREHRTAVGRDYLPLELIDKWFDSILNMQGDSDRHLEVAFDGETPVGFLYGKVDHAEHRGFVKPGFGYIMEFYVAPEYRRRSVGTKLFRRIETLFASDGAEQMYLTADEITGEPFWTAMGFKPSGEVSPETKTEIYIKNIVKLSALPPSAADAKSEICREIMESLPDWFGMPEGINEHSNSVRSEPFWAMFDGERAVGFIALAAHNPHTAEIGVMGILPECHRHGIGKRLMETVAEYCRERGYSFLLVKTVDASSPDEYYARTRAFYAAMGFLPLQVIDGYWDENNPCLLMGKWLGRTKFETLPLDEHNAQSAYHIYSDNLDALGGEQISGDEFCSARREEERGTDERNFLVTRGALPLAWLKINGLDTPETAWISMLAVEPEYQRQGVGTFAVKFAEDYARSKGKSHICLQTSSDSAAANSLYQKLGYTQSKEQTPGRVFYEKRLSADVIISAISVGNELTDCSGIIVWAKTWDWGVGEILAARLESNDFEDFETAFAATVGGKYAGLCVLEKTDDYGTDINYSPFITAVYVDPKFRSRHFTEKLLDAACDYARTLGFPAVYLISNEHGLYEKYGFEVFEQTVTITGGTEPVYRKLLRK